MHKRRIPTQNIRPITHQAGIPTYEVHSQPSWQLESPITECESVPGALAQYKQRTQTQTRIKRRTPQVNPRTTEGWRSPNLIFSTTPINPDLDTHPTHIYELIQHPTQHTHTHGTAHTRRHNHMHNRKKKTRQAPRHLQARKHEPTTCRIPSQTHLEAQHITQSRKDTKRTPTHQIEDCFRNTATHMRRLANTGRTI